MKGGALTWKRTTVEFMTLVPLVLVCVVSNKLLPWAALLASFFLVWRIYRSLRLGFRKIFQRQRLAPFVGLLLFMLAISALITIDPDNTYPQSERVLVGIAVCLAIRDWVQAGSLTQRAGWLHLGLVGLGTALAFVSPFVVEWQGSKLPNLIPPKLYTSFPLLVSDGANPNVMAAVLALLLPLAVSPLLRWSNSLPQKNWAIRGLYGLGAVSMTIMLVLTQSRGAWMASAVGFVVLANLRWRHVRAVTLVVMAAVVLLALALPTQRARWLEVLSSGGSISGSAERVEIWTHAWYVIQDFSFTGVGMGNFRRVNELFYPLYIAPSDAPHAHNLFLQVAVDLGLPGFFAWFGILLHSTYSAFQGYRRGISNPLRALNAGLLTGQMVMAVHGLTDAAVWGVMRTALIVWLVWGLANAMRNAEATAEHPLKERLAVNTYLPQSV